MKTLAAILTASALAAAARADWFSVATVSSLDTNAMNNCIVEVRDTESIYAVTNGVVTLVKMARVDGLALNFAPATNQIVQTFVPTNSALSNITVNLNLLQSNTVILLLTNNATFTNWVAGPAGTVIRPGVTYVLRAQLITRGVNWGNLGGSNPGFGVAIWTNAANPLPQTIVPGNIYEISFPALRTNIFPRVTVWQ